MQVRAKVFAVANVAGLICYTAIYLGIVHQQHTEQRGPDFGDSLNYLLSAFPILVGFTLLNLFWEAWAVVQAIRYGKWQHVLIGGGVLLSWASVFLGVRQLA